MCNLHYLWGIPVIMIFGLLYWIVTKDREPKELDAATELGNMP